MADGKITLLCPIIGAPGKGAALKAALLKLAAATVQEKGNICYKLHATSDPDEFFIYEQWKDQAALDSHMNEPHLQNFLADEDHLLAGQPAGKFVTELEA